MSLWAFLRGRSPEGLLLLACALLITGLLCLMGLPTADAYLVLALLLVAAMAAWLLEWARTRRFFDDLRDIAAAKGDALALAAELARPDHTEGILVWDALRAVLQDANSRIGAVRVREADYRDYIETWVHEVKTPLAAADLMLDNMVGVNTNPMRRELDQVNAYVEQALFYARSTDVEKDFLARVCDLRKIVADSIKSRASNLIGCGMTPDLSGMGEGPVEVVADPKWVTFILGQLIDNALRYRADQAVRHPRISFSVRTREGVTEASQPTVLLDVRDNGLGISAADIGRVFERGFTGENGRRRKKSTGIGLYLVRTLCDKMGLEVAVTSLPGEWTCFTIAFPSAGGYSVEREAGPVE